MAETTGKIVTCDRCGAEIFLKCTGEGEADGGYTRWNKFEAMPEGWDLVAVPKSVGWTGHGNAYNMYLQVCPDCHKLWHDVVIEHFLKGTPYYKEVKDGQ